MGGRTLVLENRATQLENRLASNTFSNSSSDKSIITEVIDQQERSHNTIIFNAPEIDGNNENDTSLIISVLYKITPNIVPVVASRLRLKSSKPCPLKDVKTYLKCQNQGRLLVANFV